MSTKTRRYRRTTLFCIALVGVLLGVAAARVAHFGISGWLVGFAAGAALIGWREGRAVAAVSLMLAGVSLGFWRGGHFMRQVEPYRQLKGEKVTIEVIADSSGVYGDAKQLQFDASHVRLLAPYEVRLPGMMVVSGFGENSVLRGDVVRATGKLYAKRGSKQAGVSFAQLEVVSRSASSLEKVRRNFLAGLNTALPEPLNQFAAGLLIGQRSELPDNVVTTLQIVGLSHVIAVSGYNLTIMAEVARKKMGKKSKFRSLLISTALILLFLCLAGSSASIARAAFVSLLTVLAAYYGRAVKPLLLILLAATYTTLMNPLNLWTDIGWYLSFLAFFGVLIVAPAIQKRITRPDKQPNALASLVIETMSAQIMTIPLGMFIFGQVSLISLVANILVVPLVPLAMLLSVVAGIAGMTAPLVAGVFALPARYLLGCMLSICSLLARIPHALAKFQIGALVMASLYAMVVVTVVIMRRKAPKYAKIAAD